MTETEFCKRFQDKLLETFNRTISFLDRNRIRWWVCGGTALGAVRHQGFIPWDDDIDILVLREDYEKLFLLRKELENDELSMKSIEDGGSFYNGFIKIYDRNTTLWERKEYPELIGIYIDVFPVEKSDISLDEFICCMSKYRHAMNRYRKKIANRSLSDCLGLLRGKHFKTMLRYCAGHFAFYSKKKSYETFLASTRQITNTPNGKHMMCLMGTYGTSEYMDAEIFNETIRMPFENIYVNVPAKYDTYLKQLYKDYMQLPPVEKRVSHHDHYYCNFSEGLTMEQVFERISQGKYIEQ